MPKQTYDLAAAVRHALETTHAVAECPFHRGVVIRVGDDAAENPRDPASEKPSQKQWQPWDEAALRKEFQRQLGEAADGYCPLCAGPSRR